MIKNNVNTENVIASSVEKTDANNTLQQAYSMSYISEI